jgi:HlyD family secretion protein
LLNRKLDMNSISQALDFNRLRKLLPKQLRSRWLIGFLIAAGLVGGGLTLHRMIARSQTQQEILTALVERQNLAITITANGTVKAERTINLSPRTAGYLKQLLVKEGDRVRQGQIVAYMDDSNLQGQLTQSQAQLAQQQANLTKLLNGNRTQEIAQSEAQLAESTARLRQLEAGNRSEDISQAQARLSQAEARLRQAEDDYRRNQNLFSQGAISQQTVNQERSDRDSAQAQFNEAQAALALQKRGTRSEEIDQARAQVAQRQQALALQKAGTRSEDIDAARAQVKNAQGSLQTIQADLNDTIIRAPFDGVVTKKFADPGSFVTPTTAGSGIEGAASNSILTLASTNQVVANLDEAKLPSIQLGQKVIVKSDAYPGRTFNAQVSQIAAQATTVQNVTSFEVKISLDEEAQRLLRAGMNTEVEFQVGAVSDAIAVPSVAIVRQEDGKTGVYVMGNNQRPVFQPVEIGAVTGNRTQIKSGLSGNEEVLISFPPGMEPKAQSGVPPIGNSPNNSSSNTSSPSNSNGSSPNTR